MHAPPLARWDAVWYRSVAVDGYRYDPASPENNIGFYPLYPLLLRGLAAVLPVPILWLGIGLSLVCLLAALCLAGNLFFEWGGRAAAIRGLSALLLFPTSFYFASVYTESLFLLLTVAAVCAARRGKWLIAGGAGFLASLTRLNGFLIAIPIGWYAWRAGRPRRREAVDAGRGTDGSRAAALAGTALPFIGAAVYPLYLWVRWGDPLLYIHSKAIGWGMRSAPLWVLAANVGRQLRESVGEPGRLENLSVLSQLASAVLFIWLTARLFRRGLVAEGLYVAATLLLLLHASTLAGMDRYVLSLFPCFFALAAELAHRPALSFACMLAGVTLQVTFLHRFVHWIMVS